MLNGRNSRHQPLFQTGLTFWSVEGLGITLPLPEDLNKGQGVIQLKPHCVMPLLAEDVVGIFSICEQAKEDGAARLQAGERSFHGPVCRVAAGAIAVETQDGFGPRPPQQGKLIFGQGGSKRRNRMPESCFCKSNGIHIAFAHNQAAFIGRAKGFARGLVAIQDTRFMKQLRIAGIEVFGFGIGLQSAATKGNHMTTKVSDWKNQSAPESVIGVAAAFRGDGKTGLNKLLCGEPFRFQLGQGCSPLVWRKTEAIA